MFNVRPSFLALMVFAAVVCRSAACQSDQSEQSAPELSLEERAERGDPEAQNEMGLAANDDHRYAEAFKWFQLAAKQGLAKAQLSVGYAYDEGLGVTKDQVEAVHWYALAAAQGNAQAEFNLGMCYHHGEGVESTDPALNRSLAIKWFSLALSHGNKGAANGLGLVYEHASSADYKEALQWYRKGAELGDAEAAYNACRLMAQGLGGVPGNYSEALRLCTEAAEGRSVKYSSWGEYGVGRIHEDGLGMSPDYAKAAEWYRKSAEQGNPASQLRLADLYANGKGVKQDLVEAYVWIAIAGSLGNPDALNELQILAPKMKEADVLKAQSRAQQWIEQHRRDPEDDPAGNIVYPK
jgi:TPR repeat protein